MLLLFRLLYAFIRNFNRKSLVKSQSLYDHLAYAQCTTALYFKVVSVYVLTSVLNNEMYNCLGANVLSMNTAEYFVQVIFLKWNLCMVYLQQFFVFSFSSPAFYCFCVALLFI